MLTPFKENREPLTKIFLSKIEKGLTLDDKRIAPAIAASDSLLDPSYRAVAEQDLTFTLDSVIDKRELMAIEPAYAVNLN